MYQKRYICGRSKSFNYLNSSCSRSKQLPLTDQITEFTPHVYTYLFLDHHLISIPWPSLTTAMPGMPDIQLSASRVYRSQGRQHSTIYLGQKIPVLHGNDE